LVLSNPVLARGHAKIVSLSTSPI